MLPLPLREGEHINVRTETDAGAYPAYLAM
jgi:hypothetical protein